MQKNNGLEIKEGHVKSLSLPMPNKALQGTYNLRGNE